MFRHLRSFASKPCPIHLTIQRNTTILCVRKNGKVVLAGDGQVSQGSTVSKNTVRKVRRLPGDVLVGFAGSTADAFTLLDRLEQKLDQHPGQLMRACVDLAKDWRSEKYLRHLEAALIVADPQHTFEITGNGDVLEPDTGIIAIGSGGKFALSAALALVDQPLEADEIVKRSMKIAVDICVYTNHTFTVETLEAKATTSDAPTTNTTTSTSTASPSNKTEKSGI